MTTVDTAHTANFTLKGPAVPLTQLPLGSRCRVEAVDENSESLLRLMEMGLTPGAVVVMEREAPLKSPYSLRLPGCTLAVRREDAERVLVTLLPESSAEGK
ncbi:MAG TPA: FeoA family protein [bacterium]